MARLADDGWGVAIHVGRWNPQQLIQRVATALAGRPQLAASQRVLTDPQIEESTKLDVIYDKKKNHLVIKMKDITMNLNLRREGVGATIKVDITDQMFEQE